MPDTRQPEVFHQIVKEGATAKDVAQWMWDRIKVRKRLAHYLLVPEIKREFGAIFIDRTDSGYDAIDPKVLREFRKLHKGKVDWDRGDKEWTLRESYAPAKKPD